MLERSRERRIALTLVIALSVITCLLAPQPAAAELSYYNTSGMIPSGNQAGFSLACANDEYVVGGGVYSTGTYNETWVNDSGPYDSVDQNTRLDDGWDAIVDNFGGESETVVGLAICTDRKPKYRTVEFEVNSVAGIATCPRGTYPIGGGVSTDGDFTQRTVATQSFPYDDTDPDTKPDGWLGRGSSQNVNDHPAARVTAACQGGKPPRYRRSDPQTAFAMNNSNDGEECKPGERGIGGGTETTSASVYPTTTYPVDGNDGDGLPDDGFGVYVDNLLTFDRTFFVWAICRRPAG
jgi:hypothetical protein